MPSADELRRLAEAIAAFTGEDRWSPSPFIEAIHAPVYARRRNVAQLKEVHAEVFENVEPFLPFGKPMRPRQDSPPLSPRSHLLREDMQPDLWFLGHSSGTNNIDAREALQDRASNGQRYRNNDSTEETAKRSQANGDTSPQDALTRPADPMGATSKRTPWHTNDTYLMSGALFVPSNCSSLGDDDVPTPKDGLVSRIRGGGEESEPTIAFGSSAEQWNTWVHYRYASPPLEEPGEIGDSKTFKSYQEPANDFSHFDRTIEDVDAKTWRKFGNVYFLKQDDDFFNEERRGKEQTKSEAEECEA